MRRLIPYAGAEKPRRAPRPAQPKTGGELLMELIMTRLAELNRQLAKHAARKKELEEELLRVRGGKPMDIFERARIMGTTKKPRSRKAPRFRRRR